MVGSTKTRHTSASAPAAGQTRAYTVQGRRRVFDNLANIYLSLAGSGRSDAHSDGGWKGGSGCRRRGRGVRDWGGGVRKGGCKVDVGWCEVGRERLHLGTDQLEFCESLHVAVLLHLKSAEGIHFR
jgi:hypothetical protein